MKCPGKYSIFSELHLKKCDNDIKNLNYKTSSYDERFGMINQNINSRKIVFSVLNPHRDSNRIDSGYFTILFL